MLVLSAALALLCACADPARRADAFARSSGFEMAIEPRAAFTNVSASCKTNVNPTYTIGGTISGIVGGSILLEDNGRDNLTLSNNGPFIFKIPIPSGSS